MTYTKEQILAKCREDHCDEQGVADLSKRLSKTVFVLQGSVIKEITLLQVLNNYGLECPTRKGIVPKFFYADSAVWEWRHDGCAHKVKDADAVSSFKTLIDYALFDLDQNTNVCWAWNREELEELIKQTA